MDETILVTPRLRLRLQRPSDVEFIVALWSDPGVTQFVGGPREPGSLRKVFTEIADNPAQEAFDLWPLETVEGVLVGYAGLLEKTILGHPALEVSYFLAPGHQGRGYAREVAPALVDYGFRTTDHQALYAIVDPDNLASIRVAEACGFQLLQTEIREGKSKSIYRILRTTPLE